MNVGTPATAPTPAPTVEPIKVLSQPQEKGQSVARHEFENLKFWFQLAMAVVVVAIVALVIQYFINTQVAFETLKDQVTAQNAKMDLIILQLRDKKLVK